MMFAEGDLEGQRRAAALRQELEKRGWIIGRDLVIDYLWGDFDLQQARVVVEDYLRLAPDVLLTNGGIGTRAVLPLSRTMPIVFVGVGEPVTRDALPALSGWKIKAARGSVPCVPCPVLSASLPN